MHTLIIIVSGLKEHYLLNTAIPEKELDDQVNKIIDSRNPSDWQIVSGWIFNKK